MKKLTKTQNSKKQPLTPRAPQARTARARNPEKEAINLTQHLAAIVEHSDDAIIGKALDETIQSWNRAAERMYGYAAKEVIGQPMNILVPDNHQDELSSILQCIRQNQVIDHLETVRKRKDGQEIQVSLTISPIKNARGQIIGASTIARDISERKQWEDIRSQLLLKVLTAQEEGRRHIARELHDELSQSLASLLIGLRALEEAKLVKGTRKQVRYLRSLTSEIMKEVNRIAMGLRPSVLDDHGLEVAVERHVADIRKTTELTIELDVLGLDQKRLSQEVENTLYRIFQEALTNVMMHAQAQRVSILIRCQAGSVRMVIEDDGKGFHVDKVLQGKVVPENLGLYGMIERATLLNGICTIESTPNQGTTVYAQIPLQS